MATQSTAESAAAAVDPQNQKLFNAGFIGITLINFLVFMVYYLLVVIIAYVAKTDLHATTSQAGLATGIYIIGTLVARLYFGKKIEVFGRRQVLTWGSIFYLITTVAYFWLPGLWFLFLIRFLNGFFYGTVSTATNTIVTAYIPAHRKGEGINYYGLSTALAAALGPFVGLLILNATDFNTTLIVCVVLVVISTIGALIFPAKNIPVTEEQRQAANTWTVDSFIEKRVAVITIIGFFMGLSYSAVLGFLSVYAAELSLERYSSYFFLVYALVVAVTRPMLGRVFDTKGEHAVLYPSYIFLAAGCFILAAVSNIDAAGTAGTILLLAGACIGLGYGNFMSNGQAVCLKLVTEPSRVGVALSTYFIGLDLGLGVGPYFHGVLHNFLTFPAVYVEAGAIAVGCMVLYMVFYKGLTEEDPIHHEPQVTVMVEQEPR